MRLSTVTWFVFLLLTIPGCASPSRFPWLAKGDDPEPTVARPSQYAVPSPAIPLTNEEIDLAAVRRQREAAREQRSTGGGARPSSGASCH